MDPEPSLYAIGIALCLVLLAFTSAVDAALTAISRHRLSVLQEESAARATVIRRLLADPYRFKAAILLINTATVIAATAFMLLLTYGLAIGWWLGALTLLLVMIVVFSGALPKALAIRNPARTAALLVNVGEEEGLIEPDEREMIEGIFSFGDTVVREVMVPRVDIIALEQNASLQEALETVIAHGHSRIPVYAETIDNITGILYAKDLLPGLRAGQAGMSLVGLLRPPHFVPEAMKVDALLKDLQARKVHLAMVVDEYGGTAGLATIEDLLEEIVGDIQDEYDVEEPSVSFVHEGELLADARVLLHDLNDLTDLHLQSQESDRLGGLVFERLGRVPRVGDQVQLENGVTITVLSMEGLRPRQLRLNYTPAGALEVSTPQEEENHDHEHA